MKLDVLLLYLLNDLAGKSGLLDQVIIFFASYFPYLVVIAFSIGVFISGYANRKKLSIFFVAIFAAAIARFGIAELIRYFYHRPRPFNALPVRHLLENGEWSFPSGHASFFFALAMAVYLYNKRWGTGLFAVAILISLARVAAGVHYPSDILGGAVIGSLAAAATFAVVRKIWPISTH